MTLYYPIPPFSVGERGELVPRAPQLCPCGEKATPGQVWVTAWYDSSGLPERWIITALCQDHRARTVGED